MSIATSCDDVYWSLALLMTGYGAEIEPRQVCGFLRRRQLLVEGAQVHLPWASGTSLSDVAAAARRLVDEGMSPVVHLKADLADDRDEFDTIIRRIQDVGVSDLVCVLGGRGRRDFHVRALETFLARLAAHRRICGLGVILKNPWGYVLESRWSEYAREVSRRLAIDRFVNPYLVTPEVSAEKVIAGERMLREFGNFVPVRVGVPGLTRRHAGRLGLLGRTRGVGRLRGTLVRGIRETSGKFAHPAADGLIAIAASMLDDPECLIGGVHFGTSFADVATWAWAHAIEQGRYVLEGDREVGFRLAHVGIWRGACDGDT